LAVRGTQLVPSLIKTAGHFARMRFIDQRCRRCTDVMTATRPYVIVTIYWINRFF
jgi:hypothetical protein